MLLAALFASKECRKAEGWRQLGRKFYDHYRAQILACLGYDQVQPLAERVPLKDEDFWYDLLGQMHGMGFFDNVSFEFLAEHAYTFFRIEDSKGSVCTKMKTRCSDYSDCIGHFLKEIKDIQKRNQEF